MGRTGLSKTEGGLASSCYLWRVRCNAGVATKCVILMEAWSRLCIYDAYAYMHIFWVAGDFMSFPVIIGVIPVEDSSITVLWYCTGSHAKSTGTSSTSINNLLHVDIYTQYGWEWPSHMTDKRFLWYHCREGYFELKDCYWSNSDGLFVSVELKYSSIW